jgi:hypothetical protein
MLANYNLGQEAFVDKYESLKFNIVRENDGLAEENIHQLILAEMEDKL